VVRRSDGELQRDNPRRGGHRRAACLGLLEEVQVRFIPQRLKTHQISRACQWTMQASISVRQLQVFICSHNSRALIRPRRRKTGPSDAFSRPSSFSNICQNGSARTDPARSAQDRATRRPSPQELGAGLQVFRAREINFRRSLRRQNWALRICPSERERGPKSAISGHIPKTKIPDFTWIFEVCARVRFPDGSPKERRRGEKELNDT